MLVFQARPISQVEAFTRTCISKWSTVFHYCYSDTPHKKSKLAPLQVHLQFNSFFYHHENI
jgi:hypothetical protein